MNPAAIVIVLLLLILPGVGLVAAGLHQANVKRNGTPAEARVSDCTRVGGRYKSDSCTGTWVAGGSLVSGDGRVVRGTVDGADRGDIGKTIDVRLSGDGDSATTTSLRVPVILIVLGAALAALGIWVLICQRRRAAVPA